MTQASVSDELCNSDSFLSFALLFPEDDGDNEGDAGLLFVISDRP